MPFQHTELAGGKWYTLSLAEQLAHIGSEVSRASRWKDKNEAFFQGAAERALELFDLTLRDSRWKGRWREVARAREVFCDAISGGKEYQSSLEDLKRYFDSFALVVRRG